MEKKSFSFDEVIIDVNIGDYNTENMEIFGANNNLMRHEPDSRDSLKPGERRLLYTMYKDGLKPIANHKKVQTILGKTMEIHPHGDAPLHGTLTGLGQEWNNTVTFIDGYGNFGSESGSKPSSARYIEARLSKFAWKCFFEDFNADVVDMKVAYDGVTKEPEYLPSRYPISLINSHFGIGYGAHVSVPPYNFTEVIDLTMELMDNPNTENILIYPDIPTTSDIIDDGQFQEICDTGEGKFRMRGKAEYIEKGNLIRITSVPFQVSTKKIVQDVIELMGAGKLEGIHDIQNHSGKKNGVSIDFYLKKEADPVTILHELYKKTDLQTTDSVQLTFVNDYQEKRYNVRSLLLEWISFRRSIKRREWSHKLKRLRERKHILETLIFILEGDNLEKTTKIFKTSKDRDEISKRLMETFEQVSSLQAHEISGMRGYEMTLSAKEKYIKELKSLDEKEIPEAAKIAKSSKRIDNIIKKELKEGVELFGSERLSKVINIEGELKFRNTSHIIVFTKNGKVKKLPKSVEKIGELDEGDFPIKAIQCENVDNFFVFDEFGTVGKLKICNLPNMDLNNHGKNIKDFVPINGNVVDVIKMPDEEEFEKLEDSDIYFFMVSRDGIVKKTPVKSFMKMNKSLLGMILKNNTDRLQDVKVLCGDKEILLFTNDGYGIKFKSGDIKETTRMSMGVKTIDSNGEYIVGADVVREDEDFMILITEKGYVKKAEMTTFNTSTRTSKPTRIMGLNEDDNLRFARSIQGGELFNIYLKNSIVELDCETIEPLPRLSKGKKLIGVRKGEAILDIKKIEE